MTAGDIFALALETKRPNTTDLSLRTAFGWTGVPIVIVVRKLKLSVEDAVYVPATNELEDHIELKVVIGE